MPPCFLAVLLVALLGVGPVQQVLASRTAELAKYRAFFEAINVAGLANLVVSPATVFADSFDYLDHHLPDRKEE